jgi:hypothetical protein
MAADETSRRAMLQTIVASAVLTATPLSVLEAATKGGKARVYELSDGSKLSIRKVGDKRFRATREEGSKTDKEPTGSFTAKTGEVITLDKGKVMGVTGGEVSRGGGNWFGAFWK